MFGTKHNECVGFESTWKVKKVNCVGSTQTTEYSVAEKGSNTLKKSEIEIQTDDEPTKEKGEVDVDKLADWLKKIYPRVKRELDDANNSQAFRGYKLQGESKDAQCKLVQTLKLSTGPEKASSKRVVALSWNCTGSTLALSCNSQHNSWCYHTGCVAVYVLTRNNTLSEVPLKKFSTDNCVSSLEFHPTAPNILAASTLTGSILVWNTRNENGEETIASLTNAHEDAITQLSWVNDLDVSKNFLIATSGTDGLLKMWKFDSNRPDLNLKVRYRVKPPILSYQHRNTGKNETTRGITCFDFSKHVRDMFLVGLEGGFIVQCSVLGTTKLKGSTEDEPLVDPSFKYYEPHKGEITRIRFSSNRSEIFLTLGTEQEIRFYVIGQEDAAKVIFVKSPLNDVAFVHREEKLVAACGTNGFLEIFNSQKNRNFENVTKGGIAKSAASTTVSVNEKRTNLVAVGNIEGEVQLWDVPWMSLAMF